MWDFAHAHIRRDPLRDFLRNRKARRNHNLERRDESFFSCWRVQSLCNNSLLLGIHFLLRCVQLTGQSLNFNPQHLRFFAGVVGLWCGLKPLLFLNQGPENVKLPSNQRHF